MFSFRSSGGGLSHFRRADLRRAGPRGREVIPVHEAAARRVRCGRAQKHDLRARGRRAADRDRIRRDARDGHCVCARVPVARAVVHEAEGGPGVEDRGCAGQPRNRLPRRLVGRAVAIPE